MGTITNHFMQDLKKLSISIQSTKLVAPVLSRYTKLIQLLEKIILKNISQTESRHEFKLEDSRSFSLKYFSQVTFIPFFLNFTFNKF